MKNDSPKCLCGLKADKHLFPAPLWNWFPWGKLLFQNTLSAEVGWTEASGSLCVDLILMVSILSHVHVRAILCHKRCRVLGKGPRRPRNGSLFLCIIGRFWSVTVSAELCHLEDKTRWLTDSTETKLNFSCSWWCFCNNNNWNKATVLLVSFSLSVDKCALVPLCLFSLALTILPEQKIA